MDILFKIIIAVIISVLIIYISRLLLCKIAKRKNSLHIKYLGSLFNVLVLFVLLFYVLSLFESTREISKTIMQSGALLLAIVTFAAQQSLGNVISGFSLAFTKPYELNDKIKVIQGTNLIAEGIVTDITIRHTIIKTFDGQSCIIPNNIMDNAVIANTNYTENVGNFLEIEIGYDSDIEKALNLVKNLVVNNKLTINTKEDTNVTLSRFTPNGIILKTTIWTKTLNDSFSACSQLRISILKEFKKYGIVIPYNTVTVRNGK